MSRTSSHFTISVLVPTFRRPNDLLQCLEALKAQVYPAREILVICRDVDYETKGVLQKVDLPSSTMRIIYVTVSGQVAALNAGLEAAESDLICITDDDAQPHMDWLEKIDAHFAADPNVGGVGGRDFLFEKGQIALGQCRTVGIVQPWGRTIGNHHLGVGVPRQVDILKGVNMSYRRAAIGSLRFDNRLRGLGAQVHNDLAFSLNLRRKGWKLIYDPTVAVDHFPAPRPAGDHRDGFDYEQMKDAVHNETLAILDFIPARHRMFFVPWAIFVGTRAAFGIVQFFRFLPTQRTIAGRRLIASLLGRWQGYRTWNIINRHGIQRRSADDSSAPYYHSHRTAS